MKTFVQICAAIIAMTLVQSSMAEESVGATDPEKLVSVIQELGYRAKLDVDKDGDPVIHSSVAGTQFALQFFGCAEDSHDQCRLLLFKVGYEISEKADLKLINDWNKKALVGRAYLEDDGDLWFEYVVNTYGGISRENFEDTFDWWEASVDDFEDHIGY